MLFVADLEKRGRDGSSLSSNTNQRSFNLSKEARKGVLVSYACERKESAFDIPYIEHGLYTGNILKVHNDS